MCDKTIYIKNMVCDRCVMVIQSVLTGLSLNPIAVKIGTIEFAQCLNHEQKTKIKEIIEPLGFELLETKRKRLVEAIKIKIINRVKTLDSDEKLNFSEYLSKSLNYEYGYLSNIFSLEEGISIEQYVINQKVEKIKELLKLTLAIGDYNKINFSKFTRILFKSVRNLSC